MKTLTKQTFIWIITFLTILFSSCFSSWQGEEGTITINLGGGNSRNIISWPPDDNIINQSEYIITLTSYDKIIILEAKGGGAISATVLVGLWNVNVKAYYPDRDTLYAEGNAEVIVKAGQNNPVTVQMEKAFELEDHFEIEDPFEDGSAEFPFLIRSEDHLRQVGTGADGWTLSAHYRLIADIELEQGNWVRIGDNPAQPNLPSNFIGNFDGNGHIITGLTISGVTGSTQGMFGTIGANGVVRNLGLVSVNINSIQPGTIVGSVAGRNSGMVENVFVTGSITAPSTVGGVVGLNQSGTVRNSYSTATVTASTANTAGGVVGQNVNGVVENVFTTGSVTASTNNAGGVVGDNTGVVKNAYTIGTVSGTNRVGGIVGVNWNNGSVENSVALNPLITRSGGTNEGFGRVAVDIAGQTAILINNRARADMVFAGLENPNITSEADGIHGLTVDFDMPLSEIFTSADGWDPAIWNIPSGTLTVGGALPTLRGFKGTQTSVLPQAGQ